MNPKRLSDLNQAFRKATQIGSSVEIIKPDRLPIVDQVMELAKAMKETGANTSEEIGKILSVAGNIMKEYGEPVYLVKAK